jgi:hypothetical protein
MKGWTFGLSGSLAEYPAHPNHFRITVHLEIERRVLCERPCEDRKAMPDILTPGSVRDWIDRIVWLMVLQHHLLFQYN